MPLKSAVTIAPGPELVGNLLAVTRLSPVELTPRSAVPSTSFPLSTSWNETGRVGGAVALPVTVAVSA